MKTNNHISLLISLMLISLSLSSCDAVKRFLNTDIQDEDYIVGQLYADEYVSEQPFRPSGSNGGNNTQSGTPGHSTGITLNDKDNRKLYSAIDSWYGTPYQYGGCSTSGVDCSCFVGNIFKSVYGITLHRTANDIQKDMSKFVDRNGLREGDVVFFTNSNGKVSHVGIYLKDDLFVHSSTSNGVSISSLENSYWKKHFYRGGRHKSVTTNYR
ncbi:MAG: C40 family peptidase [Bacteroidales bacterium]|nr:C40 family peptidase [Bacteroidales bacterium]